MSRRPIKPVYDDEADLDGDMQDEEMTKQVITQGYMEDIGGILNQAYVDIEAKVSKLVEALEDE